MASRNSLVFETDVNMDGLLSDCSNDSSSSSTENNHLSSLMLSGHHAGSLSNNANNTGLSSNNPNNTGLSSNNPNNTGLSNNNNQVMFSQQTGTGTGTGMQSQQQLTQNESSMMDKSRVKNESLSNGSSQSMNNGSTLGPKKILPPNGKKTKGRVKIKMEFIDNKLRRYTTFSKRKTGIMKKVITSKFNQSRN